MKPWEKTSKYNNKSGENKKRREEINKAIDREMDKAPDEIDTQKVDALVELLNRLDKNVKMQDMLSKDVFAQKFLNEYIDINKLTNEDDKK